MAQDSPPRVRRIPAPPQTSSAAQPLKRSLRLNAAACWEWDVAADAVRYSPEWRDILALDEDAPLGSDFRFLLARSRKADSRAMENLLADIRAGRRGKIDIPIRVKRFDSTWAWILLRAASEEPVPAKLYGIAIVVSALRLNNRFFPPSLDDNTQSTYHGILEHSPNNIVRFDRELFPLYMNPAVSTMVPMKREELGSRKAAELNLCPSDIEFLQTQVDKVFATGEIVKARRSLDSKQGRELFVADYTFWPEFDTFGNVRSVISLQQDLTAEVLREREAHANEMRIAALYQLTQMTDAPEEAIVSFVVQKIAELTNSSYSHLHVLPGSLREKGHIFWSAEHYDILSPDELATPDPDLIRGEFGFDLREGEPLKPLIRNTPVLNSSNLFFRNKLRMSRFLCAPALEDGKVMCIAAVYNKPSEYTAADMRQLEMFINGAWLALRRMRYVEQLRAAKENAEKANRVKDRFLANVSHELRTPLNGMLSMLQLLETTPMSPEQREYSGRANVTGKTLLRIISDILDYTRMESGVFELERAPFSIHEALVGSVNLFSAEAENKGIRLELSMRGGFPPLVLGDEARVRQIVFNLIGNALKFTERGKIHVSCKAEPKGANAVWVTLSVRDTGIGIPRDMQEKIFDAFTQVDASTTRKHQGSGLGLGIVRHLTEHMGGSVHLESEPGKGTTIVCRLPFVVCGANASPAPAEGGPPPPGHTGYPSLTVLVAEDDAVSRLAMRLFLERLGHRVACAANGREALEALRLYPFDCLISDVLMPEMDGIEVTRHVRDGEVDSVTPSQAVIDLVREALPGEAIGADFFETPRDLPIIAVSAHAMKGDREYFLDAGMDYYLSKPMTIKDLDAMLRRVYESHIAPLPQA